MNNLSNDLLLFDLNPHGHHPVYLRHLMQHWHQHQIPGCLQLVVSPEMVENHSDLLHSQVTGDSRIEFTVISASEYQTYRQARSLIQQSFIEWSLFCRYAKALNSTQALLLYLDSLQLPLAFGERSPCPVSGIYFRPSFHYPRFLTHSFSRKEQIKHWRQKVILSRILQRSQFKTLFSLDQFAIPDISRLSRKSIVALADPVESTIADPTEVTALRQQLQIGADRHVLLLFGELSDRKGVYQVLAALKLLSDTVQRQLCLLLVGAISPYDQSIPAEVEQLKQTTAVQIILCDRYVKNAEVPAFFGLADTVLALYQRHVGMSSILLHAAAAQKPVLTSDYGLMSKLTEHYQLGMTLRAEDPAEIALGINRRLNLPIEAVCSVEKMSQLAQLNRVEIFTDTLFAQLLDCLSTQSAANWRLDPDRPRSLR